MEIDFSHWGPGFDAFMAAFAGRFPRIEPRRRASSYVRGLLSELERKNGWTLAEGAGDKTPDGMQRLLNASRWDESGALDDLRAVIVDSIGDKENAILVVDLCRPWNYADHCGGRPRDGLLGRTSGDLAGQLVRHIHSASRKASSWSLGW